MRPISFATGWIAASLLATTQGAAQQSPPPVTVAGTVVGVDTMIHSASCAAPKAHHPGTPSGGTMSCPMMAAGHEHGGHAGMMGSAGGLGLRIATGTDTISVHLGPIAFLRAQEGGSFAIGDQVTVVAAEMTEMGQPHWMAYSVTKGDLELRLRDPDGRPRWMAHQGGHSPK